jgi:hypothetical protein
MLDIAMLTLVVGGFALAKGYALVCDRLMAAPVGKIDKELQP